MAIEVVDTCRLYLKRRSDDKVFIKTAMQLAEIAQTLGINEKVFGDIGNKPLFVMKGQKEVTLNIRHAFYDSDLLSIAQSASIEEGKTVTVYSKTEDELIVVDNGGDLEVTLTGTPKGDTVYVRNANGDVEEAAVASKVVTIPTGHAKAGEYVSVTYAMDVTGDVIAIDGEEFGGSYYCELYTIAYDTVTNEVVKDIYIQLYNVVNNNEWTLSFENGNPIAPELTFECLNEPNTTKIGQIIEVPRT